MKPYLDWAKEVAVAVDAMTMNSVAGPHHISPEGVNAVQAMYAFHFPPSRTAALILGLDTALVIDFDMEKPFH